MECGQAPSCFVVDTRTKHNNPRIVVAMDMDEAELLHHACCMIRANENLSIDLIGVFRKLQTVLWEAI